MRFIQPSDTIANLGSGAICADWLTALVAPFVDIHTAVRAPDCRALLDAAVY